MSRRKDVDWNLPDVNSWDSIHTAVLMDLRDELKNINKRLNCYQTIAIPHVLRNIEKNTKTRQSRIGIRIKRIRKSLKKTIRKLKRGLSKRSLR